MTPSDQLRDIAGALRAQFEEGAFDPLNAHVREDIRTLPATLEQIAREAEGGRMAA